MARPDRNSHDSVIELLKNLRGLDPLKEMFWSQLNYQRVNEPLSRRGWGHAASQALAESPVLFATGGNDAAFHIIYARLDSHKLRLGLERPVISRLLHDHPYSLFVFSNESQDRWHFVNSKFADDPKKRRLFRRITVGPEERLRTASERLAMLDLASVGPDLFSLSPLAIQERHDKAFDVEAVTKQFYEEYKAVFKLLRDDLGEQTRDKHWAHDYALQFLNRCMFLYFVQRKGWLGDDPEFLGSFWNAYNDARQAKDSFFDKWLRVLFFEAFNDRFHGGHRHFPKPVHEALAMAPYLNGGLFKPNDLDDPDRHDFKITDARFEQVFKFLEGYNFTISEDSPLDQEVAVDPEMIGKVYESLVNVSEEADECGEAGIFYTPRTEIDLMCRLALVDNLTNNLGQEHKNLFYEAVFALDPQEKEQADVALTKAKLWPALDEHLQRLTVVDPACGSGSFLVGMLHILDDLRSRAARQLSLDETAYDRKKGIIGRSLYGVDVMEWACHVAELRLWLALIIDVEMSREQLHTRREPLLPHFSFKIRCGDSLVQEVGGISLSHRRGSTDIPKAIKDRLRKLQNTKLAFYNNEPVNGLKTEAAIKNEEVVIFRDLLGARAAAVEEEAKKLMRIQAAKPMRQRNLLTGETEGPAKQLSLAQEQREKQIAALLAEAAALKKQQAALRHPKDVPLVWDIAFAEVMESDTGGFDIVVGNPPYVRQENIAAPVVGGRQVTENKKEYKAMLARSVYQAWPTFFGYKASTDTASHKIDAKSDLYIYFYLHGLSLLNDKGSFIFITSNSWLDVGYGKDLQEFLLRRGHVKMVIDNQAKRSFVSADVNTVISLLASPDDRAADAPGRIARFVMFKVPFEQVLSPVLFEEIGDASDRRATAEYRLSCLTQDRLFEEGCEVPQEEDAEEQPPGKKAPRSRGPLIKVAKYIGNKWGGKYLRAPDIYWTILDKGQGKLVRLGHLALVRRGFTSGANDFFYLDKETINHWTIEKRFLRPLFKGPKDVTTYQMRAKDLSSSVFYCTDDRNALKGTNALRYIKWGEQATVTVRQGPKAGSVIKGFHQLATVASRNPWYALNAPLETRIFLNKGINDRHFVCLTDEPIACDQQLYQVRPADDVDAHVLGIVLNCTMTAMFAELIGRCNFGQGVLWLATYEVAQFPVLSPNLLSAKDRQTIELSFRGLGGCKPLSVVDEIQVPERLLLDECIMSFLKLTKGEREAVYEAVVSLVAARLNKSESV